MDGRRMKGRLTLAALLLLAGCGHSAKAAEDNPLLTAPTEATTTLVSPTTAPPTTIQVAPTSAVPTTVALPVPIKSPGDPLAPEPDIVLGTLDIPKIGVHKTLRDGIRLTTLDKSPGHWPGSALPGQVGNMVIAGHRVTHDKPFRNIDKLVAGDDVTITLADGKVVSYKVSSTEVVANTALWIVDQTSESTGTLFACHPPGSARERFVVHLKLAAT
jgi:sortase A